jgi:pectin methylesterase-like acyl-CoA thioesterase
MLNIYVKVILLFASFTFLKVFAQDRRSVEEPVFPKICSVLVSKHKTVDIDRFDDQELIQAQINNCSSGQAVMLAADNEYDAFISGPITLKSGVSLILGKDVTLFASNDSRKFDSGEKKCGEMSSRGNGCKPFIHAFQTNMSGIYGPGKIDGRGGVQIFEKEYSWWQLARTAQKEGLAQSAPRLVQIENSENFVVYGVQLENSPNFHLVSKNVKGFTVWGAKIFAPSNSRNTDGIDLIASSDVTVIKSFISVGDDQVAIKSNASGSSQYISILNNHFYSGHGMSIGSEVNGGVHHVLIKGLTIDGSTSGLRIKSNKTRGGLVDNVSYESICIANTKKPIELTAYYGRVIGPGENIPQYKNIKFKDVTIVDPGDIIFNGYSSDVVIESSFKNVKIPKGSIWNRVHSNINTLGSDLRQYDCSERFVEFVRNKEMRSRPQLRAVDVSLYSKQVVLSSDSRQADVDWYSTSKRFEEGGRVVRILVDAANSSLTGAAHTSIMHAVNEALILSADSTETTKFLIQVAPGVYNENVYIPKAKNPIKLIGLGKSPSDVVITSDLNASVTGKDYESKLGLLFNNFEKSIVDMYETVKVRPNITTFGTATLWSKNVGFEIENLTIQNTYQRNEEFESQKCVDDCQNLRSKIMQQAVALMLDGADKSKFINIRIKALQDSLYVGNEKPEEFSHSYFVNSYIEGDVDYIFGDGIAYFEDSEIKTITNRPQGYVAAPSTSIHSPYGFFFNRCLFTNDGGVHSRNGSYRLARQWFRGQRCTPYMGGLPTECKLADDNFYMNGVGRISIATINSVGKMAVLNSTIHSHISPSHPWGNWNKPGSISYRPVHYEFEDFIFNLNMFSKDKNQLNVVLPLLVKPNFWLIEYNNSGV